MKFLFDTSFLMNALKFKIDIKSELMKFGKPEIYSTELVINELKKLVEKGGKDRIYAKLSLELLKEAKIIKSLTKNTDKDLEMLSDRFVVCTQDKALINRLRKKNVHIVLIRQRKYFTMI